MEKRTKLQIDVERVPNPDMMSFHVNREISKSSIQNFWFPLRESSEKYLDDVGEIGAELVQAVFQIPGIMQAYLHRYELTVEKAKLFSWERIQPRIIAAIKRALRRRKVVVIITDVVSLPEGEETIEEGADEHIEEVATEEVAATETSEQPTEALAN